MNPSDPRVKAKLFWLSDRDNSALAPVTVELPLSSDPVLRSKQAGDMYVQVLVETPQKLTKRQRELLAEFEKQSSSETHPESSGFFAKVKDFLDGLGKGASGPWDRPGAR